MGLYLYFFLLYFHSKENARADLFLSMPQSYQKMDDPSLVKKKIERNTPAQREISSAFGAHSSDVVTADATPVGRHQASIPPLPVPDLKHTLKLYLRSLEGILNAEEYAHTERCAEHFVANGQGEKLQQLLQAKKEAAKDPSWLEVWWDDGYLVTRDPLPINVNYFFTFANHPLKECHHQISRAASLVHGAATACVQIRTNTWSNDLEGKKKTPLCMSQYQRVFCTSRIPHIERDYILQYTTRAQLEDERRSRTVARIVREDPRHIIVLCRNYYFAVDVIADDGSVEPLDVIGERIAACFVTATMPGRTGGPPVGVLTTNERTAWAKARTHLVSLGNEPNLIKIQSSLFVLVLEGVEAHGFDESARLNLHGAGTNRWFDRHNMIVTPKGRAAMNFEHAVGDGATTLRVVDEIMAMEKKRDPKTISKATAQAWLNKASASTESQGVVELSWNLEKQTDNDMKIAYAAFRNLVQSTETAVLNFRHFGGSFIKKMGVSPDAFVQIAFQLTHYRLFGRIAATYEATSTRQFLHGRTEVTRSASRPVLDFCEVAAQYPVLGRKINSAIPEPAKLLKQAAVAHVDYMRKAKAGHGVDRHLLGLRMVCAEAGLPKPDLFLDSALTKSCHWTLSTSHCGSSNLRMFGFGPVVNDGFGLGYMIHNENVNVCVTSKYTHRLMSSTIFVTTLESSLLYMKALLQADWEKRSKHQPGSLSFTNLSHPTTLKDVEYCPKEGFRYKHVKRQGFSKM